MTYIQAMEMSCFLKLLGISYRDHITNEEVEARKHHRAVRRPPDFSEKTQTGSGTGTSHDHLDWPGLSYREQVKEEDEEADRGNDGKTKSKSGLALNC